MKKTLFTALRAMCVGAMTLFAVSCYDDSALWNEVDRLDGRIDSLANALNNDVANLNALQTAMTELKTSLEKAIAEGDAAVKKALEDQLASVKTALEQAIADGDATLQATLETEKKALLAALESLSGDVATLQTAMTTLEETLGVKYEELVAKVDAADGVLDGKISDINTALEVVKKAYAEADTELKKSISEETTKAIAEALLKVTVQKVEEVEGVVVLTLADGSTVKLSKPLTNVDNDGLVTIVEVDGVKYWKVVGAETHTGVQVGHPDQKIEFQINGSTNELEYRVNGAAWTTTGVEVLATDANVKLITSVVETDDYVTITVGGEEYQLPKYVVDNSSLVPGRTDFFLRYEGAKAVEFTAHDIAEYYVMSKPDGWKASFDENVLNVTAPTKAAVMIGAAETEGEILVHATTSEGLCKVVSIDVTTGPGVTMTLNADGTMVVENSYYGEKVSMWGDVSFGFLDVAVGLATPESFNEDPAAYFKVYNDTWYAPNRDIVYPSIYNAAYSGNEYEEGVYETDVIETSVNDLYYKYNYEDLPDGAHYVVWVAPLDSDGKIVIEDAVYAEYVNVQVEVTLQEATHSNIVLNVNAAGASSYIVGCVADSYYSEYGTTFDEYMQSSMGGPWTGFQKYGSINALGIQYTELPSTLNLADIAEEMNQTMLYGETYKVWVMPLLDHLTVLDEANSYPEDDYYVYDLSAYSYEDNFLPYVYEFKTNDIIEGGAYEASLEVVSIDYTSIKVKVTPADNTETVWYYWYATEDYNEFEDDATLMADVMSNCYNPLTAAGQVSVTYKNPGESYTLVTFSVGNDGKYGPITELTRSTLAIPYDEEISVTLESLTEDGNNYVAVVNVTGATKVAGYYCTDSEYYRSSFEKQVAISGVSASYYGYQFADVTGGKATLTFSKNSYKSDYYVSGYNINEDGDAVAGMSAVKVFNIATNLPAAEEE